MNACCRAGEDFEYLSHLSMNFFVSVITWSAGSGSVASLANSLRQLKAT